MHAIVVTLNKDKLKEIISMKKDAIVCRYKCFARYNYRHDIKKLSEAWMKYIDYLGLDVYKPKHFRNIFTDNPFTTGEMSAITSYLIENNFIEKDNWGRYIVKWRKGGNKFAKKTKKE